MNKTAFGKLLGMAIKADQSQKCILQKTETQMEFRHIDPSIQTSKVLAVQAHVLRIRPLVPLSLLH